MRRISTTTATSVAKQTDYEKTRYMLNWQHKGGLDSRLLTKVDYTKISDPYYFQDLKSYDRRYSESLTS